MDDNRTDEPTPEAAPFSDSSEADASSAEDLTGEAFQGESEELGTREKFGLIYDDMMQFASSLGADYDLYPGITDLIRRGTTEISLKKQIMRKTLDATWISVIEQAVIPLDNVIRKPSRFIEENEEVLPIELSRNITSRSMRHLAQHTDYISRIEGDEITPSKILNVFKDETIQTYENRFVNTLLNRLFIFVSRRYDQAKENGRCSQNSDLSLTTKFENKYVKGKFHLSLELTEAGPAAADGRKPDPEELGLWTRLEKLKSVVSTYIASPFVREMGRNYVRPPIMRTNAINKNKDLRQCLALWEFIESYDGVGYELAVEERAEKLDERYLEELYSNLAAQYCIFRYNMNTDIDEEMILAVSDDGEPFKPRFVDSLDDYETDDFNIYDTAYQKYMPINRLNPRRKLTPEEWKIRRAIDLALKADRIRELKRLAEEAERRRLAEEEAARRKAEEEEKARLAEEAELLQKQVEKDAQRLEIEELERQSAEEEERRLTAEENELERKADLLVESAFMSEEERTREREEADAQRRADEAAERQAKEEEERAISEVLNPPLSEEEKIARAEEELRQLELEESEADRKAAEDEARRELERLALTEAELEEISARAEEEESGFDAIEAAILEEEEKARLLAEEKAALSEAEEKARRIADEKTAQEKADAEARRIAEEEELARLAEIEDRRIAAEETIVSDEETEAGEAERSADEYRLKLREEEVRDLRTQLIARLDAETRAEEEDFKLGLSLDKTEELGEEEESAVHAQYTDPSASVANLRRMGRKRKKKLKKLIEKLSAIDLPDGK